MSAPPTRPRDNWQHQPPKKLVRPNIINVLLRLEEMTTREGLQPADLLAGYIMRRVPPIQL